MPTLPMQKRSFHSLSVQDLLEARDTYHVHLAHIDNVVATAVGRFRYRKGDKGYEQPYFESLHADEGKKKSGKATAQKEPRRLDNSKLQSWSPPCVYVFVNSWLGSDDFRARPDQVIPEYLYLADGRVIPTCTILVEEQPKAPSAAEVLSLPSSLVGGGYPITREVQGVKHVGSVGCLVTDGEATYVLTNRHVCGEPGNEVFTKVKGKSIRVGISARSGITKMKFDKVYDGWPGTRAFVNIDAGLVRVDDIGQFTTQIYGLGELEEPLDLNPDTISTGLIGANVAAFGAASGNLRGQIIGLFYRYKSMGGFDYVADFLIGSIDASSMKTLPGDSGTIWCLTVADESSGSKNRKGSSNGGVKGKYKNEKTLGTRGNTRYYPLAMQWGGHIELGGAQKTEFHYALATSLSTVCRTLDLDIIRDWNLGHLPYWGEMGHYTIGAKACEVVSDNQLSKLMIANQSNIGFEDADLKDPEKYKRGTAHYRFVPLADVADDVWRTTRPSDSNNHFADMDQSGGGKYKGQDLLTLCQDADNVDAEVWNDFYDALPADDKANKGALPFRVWQLFDEMVFYLNKKDISRFVCAAGVVAHYVGDACQPLHVSHLHHGYPPLIKGSVAYNVHSTYESKMLDDHADDVVSGVNDRIKKATVDKKLFRTGKEAAQRVIQLMRDTFEKIPPDKLVDAYNNGGNSDDERSESLWKLFGEDTMDCLVDGAACMATIWQSAWKTADTSWVSAKDLVAIDQQVLMNIYNDNTFARSVGLPQMIPILQGKSLPDDDSDDTDSDNGDDDGTPLRRRKTAASGRHAGVKSSVEAANKKTSAKRSTSTSASVHKTKIKAGANAKPAKSKGKRKK